MEEVKNKGYGINPETAAKAAQEFKDGWENAPEGYGIDLKQADGSEFSKAWNNGGDTADDNDEQEKDA